MVSGLSFFLRILIGGAGLGHLNRNSKQLLSLKKHAVDNPGDLARLACVFLPWRILLTFHPDSGTILNPHWLAFTGFAAHKISLLPQSSNCSGDTPGILIDIDKTLVEVFL